MLYPAALCNLDSDHRFCFSKLCVRHDPITQGMDIEFNHQLSYNQIEFEEYQ
jgi:hypothetical protein